MRLRERWLRFTNLFRPSHRKVNPYLPREYAAILRQRYRDGEWL